jgi:molecular chaperone GrpE
LNQGHGDNPEGKPDQPLKDSPENNTPREPEWGRETAVTPETSSTNEDVSTLIDDTAKTDPIPSDRAGEVQQIRAKLAEKEAQIEKIMVAYRGLKQENEKVRQRMEQNQKRHLERSKNEFIGQFVEVLDNLDRAIESIENNFDADSVLQGIILLRSRLVQLLRQEGLEKIFVGGQPFDPTHSEAAAIEPVDNEAEDNIVMQELQRGYMLRGALLRPARVVVGRFSGPRDAADEEPASSFPDDPSSEN